MDRDRVGEDRASVQFGYETHDSIWLVSSDEMPFEMWLICQME